jgi:hypothetical protein
MDESIPFASRGYWLLLVLLVLSRGMDFLSTWVATPNLMLEGNPIAKKLGWGRGAVLNIAVCLALARWPLAALALSTTSLLVAARNFQSAWLMRSMGEGAYRDWHVERLRKTSVALYLSCLAGNTVLPAAVGMGLIYFGSPLLVASGIGVGILVYAVAVAFYSLLGLWRLSCRNCESRRLRQEDAAASVGESLQSAEMPPLARACENPPGPQR